MGFFRTTHHKSTSSNYDEEEPLQSHQHEVLELEPTTHTAATRRTSFSSDASSFYDETTAALNDNNSESKQRQRQKRRQRYQQKQQRQRQQQRHEQQQQQHHGGNYQRLGGQIADAWHTVTGFPRHLSHVVDSRFGLQGDLLNGGTDGGHFTEDDDAEPTQYPANDMNNQLKRSLYLLLEEPSSSRAAFWTNVIVSFLIVSSALMTTIETIPAFRSAESNRVWFHLESTMVALFTLEYILRLFAHSDSLKMLKNFVIAPISIIDFISIVPFYIEVIAQRDTTYEFRFTILRLFRLLRLFKTYKYSNAIVMTIEVMMVALRRSGDALSALFFFLLAIVILLSTLLYFAERGTWDETLETFVDPEGNTSVFDSIPAAFWFVLVTITTTGYGDMVPTTFIGKLVTFPAMMFGVLLIALPSIIIGRNFTVVWEMMKRRQYLEQLQQTQVMDGSTGPDMNGPPDNVDHTMPTTLSPSSSTQQPHQASTRRPSMMYDDPLGPPLSSFRPRSGSMNTISGNNDSPFNLLDTGDEALFNQLQALMAITRQNQDDIQRILKILEQRSTSNSSSSSFGHLNNSSQENHQQHQQQQKQKQPQRQYQRTNDTGMDIGNVNTVAGTTPRKSLDMITEE